MDEYKNYRKTLSIVYRFTTIRGWKRGCSYTINYTVTLAHNAMGALILNLRRKHTRERSTACRSHVCVLTIIKTFFGGILEGERIILIMTRVRVRRENAAHITDMYAPTSLHRLR